MVNGGGWNLLLFIKLGSVDRGIMIGLRTKEKYMLLNVVIGTPLVAPEELLAFNLDDWNTNERQKTLFTETRYLPAILKEAGIVSSTNEVRKNNPKLNITLDRPDCMMVKWGKKFLFIVVGE